MWRRFSLPSSISAFKWYIPLFIALSLFLRFRYASYGRKTVGKNCFSAESAQHRSGCLKGLLRMWHDAAAAAACAQIGKSQKMTTTSTMCFGTFIERKKNDRGTCSNIVWKSQRMIFFIVCVPPPPPPHICYTVDNHLAGHHNTKGIRRRPCAAATQSDVCTHFERQRPVFGANCGKEHSPYCQN